MLFVHSGFPLLNDVDAGPSERIAPGLAAFSSVSSPLTCPLADLKSSKLLLAK